MQNQKQLLVKTETYLPYAIDQIISLVSVYLFVVFFCSYVYWLSINIDIDICCFVTLFFRLGWRFAPVKPFKPAAFDCICSTSGICFSVLSFVDVVPKCFKCLVFYIIRQRIFLLEWFYSSSYFYIQSRLVMKWAQ